MNVHELARIARQDLTTILDLARWAHADAYQANAPNPDAKRGGRIIEAAPAPAGPATVPCPICHGAPPAVPGATCTGCDGHGTITAPLDQHDDDLVPGPTHDLGIGSHPSRRAWQVSVTHLAHAERYTATALHLATGERPRLTKPGPASPLPDIEATIQRTRARLGRIANAPSRPPVLAALRVTVIHTEQAWGALNHAFTRGKADPDTQATDHPRCIICGWRPRADKSGKRCNTCYSWYRRNKRERPVSLDGDKDEPRRAQARRLERGDGWGDESASCTLPRTDAQAAALHAELDRRYAAAHTDGRRTEHVPTERPPRVRLPDL